MSKSVDFWFDFVSSYSWIAMSQAETFAQEHEVTWRLRPFVLGAVLKQRDRRTVAQVDATRGYAHFDSARVARRLGLRMNGPKEHPFLSLKALRAHVLFQDASESLALARALFAAAWERCLGLTDPDVVIAAVAEVGLPTDGLAERLEAPETKALLRQNTDEALSLGVFGAPFFIYDGEPFWGQDRMPYLAERLAGVPGLDVAERERFLSEGKTDG